MTMGLSDSSSTYHGTDSHLRTLCKVGHCLVFGSVRESVECRLLVKVCWCLCTSKFNKWALYVMSTLLGRKLDIKQKYHKKIRKIFQKVLFWPFSFVILNILIWRWHVNDQSWSISLFQERTASSSSWIEIEASLFKRPPCNSPWCWCHRLFRYNIYLYKQKESVICQKSTS